LSDGPEANAKGLDLVADRQNRLVTWRECENDTTFDRDLCLIDDQYLIVFDLSKLDEPRLDACDKMRLAVDFEPLRPKKQILGRVFGRKPAFCRPPVLAEFQAIWWI
jgi:hypothetical protein